MPKLIFILLFSIGVDSVAQTVLENSTWITCNKTTLKFYTTNVSLTQISYISGYEIYGDTLHFIHDFSGMEVLVGNKKVPRKEFELPDSYFKILKLSQDTLVISAINPTAVHLINRITRNYNYFLNDEDAIKWANSSKRPDHLSNKIDTSLTLWNITTITKERIVYSISMSTVSYGWVGIHYFDIRIDSNLTYSCRTIIQEYEHKKKCEYFFHTGSIDSTEYLFIQKLYGQTDLPDSGNVNYNQTMASHDENFILTIKHNFGITTIEGNRASLPDYVRTFFDSINREFPKDQDKIEDQKQEYPLSKFKIN